MVYLFEPIPRPWKRAAGYLGYLVDKQVEGIPLQPSDIPPVKGIDRYFELSDFNSATHGFRFVSDRGRAALDELAPGCVAFFPLRLETPDSISADDAYFFFDVLPRAQLIDWDQSPTIRRIVHAPEGRENRKLADNAILNLTVKFNPTTGDTPPIWREADVHRSNVHFFSNKKHIFLRDDVWERLNARFPEQLVARKFA